MNKTKDMDNHLKADTVIDSYAFSDKEHTLLPNDVSVADSEHSQADTLGTGEYEIDDAASGRRVGGAQSVPRSLGQRPKLVDRD